MKKNAENLKSLHQIFKSLSNFSSLEWEKMYFIFYIKSDAAWKRYNKKRVDEKL